MGYRAYAVGLIGVRLKPEVIASKLYTEKKVPGCKHVTRHITEFCPTCGKVAYEMATYQFMQEYLEIKNEEMQQTQGRNITIEEENQFKTDMVSLAKQYGLWEAIPEAIAGGLDVAATFRRWKPVVGQLASSEAVRSIA